MRRNPLLPGLLAAAAATLAAGAHAQDSYPSKPTTRVVPFAAGSGTARSGSPESVATRTRSGSFAINLGVAEAGRFAAGEVTRWARYVKDSGVKPEQ